MYVVDTSLKFAVYLAILQLGVRTFVTELTNSFQGISNTFLPGAVPGIDCAATYGFGSPNAVTIGFLFGALGQFIAIVALLLLKSPTIVIAGFVPVFFDNATIAVYANNKGGIAANGGYLGMWDWAVVWPIFTVIMKYAGFIGLAIILVVLILIPQLQYRSHPDTYFLCVEDYEAYKEKVKKE